MFNTNKNLEQKVKASMATSLDFIELHSIITGQCGALGSRGLVRLVTRGCGFESRLRLELSTTEERPLSKAPNPQLLPGHRSVGCPHLQVCALGWVKCREHISLLVILCIIVYVTNKAHLSLIYYLTVRTA